MSLVEVDFPAPKELRNGWAALAAVCAAQGWSDDVFADGDKWFYHDGGGNWASLRIFDDNKAVLIGHDHEYSETYYGKAAEFFEEEETDLLAGAPDWWSVDLDPTPQGEWIGFVYGWNGTTWQRVNYTSDDGFAALDLNSAFSITNTENLAQFSQEAPGNEGEEPSESVLKQLVNAGAHMTSEQLAAVIPGWNIAAGIAAARKFLEAKI